MSTKVVRVGRIEQAITTQFQPGKLPGFMERHEHVTLQTPAQLTETQKLRLMTYHEAKQSWMEQQ
jgi:hypothetical protein